jgi:hypothetical protein
VGETITDTDISPARSIRTKDFDAKDFGLEPGSAFIVRQVWVRVGWPVSITDNTTPDTNWPLEFTFKLHGDTNLDQATGSVLATTAALSWSSEDRANDQWHAVGLSSQEHATTSVGLEIVSVEGDAPRRHSITGIAFDVEGIKRNFIQPEQMLHDNITTSISGTVTGGENGTAYLCPSDPLNFADQRTVSIDEFGAYEFADINPGTYEIYVNNDGNTESDTAIVVVAFGDMLVEDFPTLTPGASPGCPIA